MPLTSFKVLWSVIKCGRMPWPTIKDKALDQMYLSFSDLDLQNFKRARQLAKCHFTTLLGAVEIEASKRFLQWKGIKFDFPEKLLLTYTVPVAKHPVVFDGPLQNHM